MYSRCLYSLCAGLTAWQLRSHLGIWHTARQQLAPGGSQGLQQLLCRGKGRHPVLLHEGAGWAAPHNLPYRPQWIFHLLHLCKRSILCEQVLTEESMRSSMGMGKLYSGCQHTTDPC